MAGAAKSEEKFFHRRSPLGLADLLESANRLTLGLIRQLIGGTGSRVCPIAVRYGVGAFSLPTRCRPSIQFNKC